MKSKTISSIKTKLRVLVSKRYPLFLLCLGLFAYSFAALSSVSVADSSLNWNSLTVGQVIAQGTLQQSGGNDSCTFFKLNFLTPTATGTARSIQLSINSLCTLTVSSKSSSSSPLTPGDPTATNFFANEDTLNNVLSSVDGEETYSGCSPNICISNHSEVCTHYNGWVIDDCVVDSTTFTGNPATGAGHGDFHTTICCNSYQHRLSDSEKIYLSGGNYVLDCFWSWSGSVPTSSHFSETCTL